MTLADVQSYPTPKKADSQMSYSEQLTASPHRMYESKVEGIREKKDKKEYLGLLAAEIGTDYTFKRKIVWKNAIGFLALHLAALYGLWLMVIDCYWLTIACVFGVALLSGLGSTAGAHRLFSHRAYKAPFITRLVLIIFQTLAGQNCLYVWVRDHRQHHKYSDTDADPHNAKRGFFFSHMGWLMSRKHPAVIAKGKAIDMSDMEADPLVMFQKKHYKLLYTIFAIILPTLVPVYGWGESWWNSFFSVYMFRNILALNLTWLVNSAAHFYGNKPFDKFIIPVECKLISLVVIGEGWHNYHHVFPWDYRAAEFGARYSVTTAFIDILSYFGLAHDLRTTPYHMVRKRIERTGDGSYPTYREEAMKLEKDVEYVAEVIKTKETSPVQRLVAAKE